LAGLEEERRLAYVGLTRAKQRIFVSFAANRAGAWLVQSALPSRFISELPKRHVETTVDEGFYGAMPDSATNMAGKDFASTYDSPGWRRAQANKAQGYSARAPPLIEAQAFTVQTSDPAATHYARGERVFHQKFGYGDQGGGTGNKLDGRFDKAGEKKVIDQFCTEG